MRQFALEDLHRLILAQAADPVALNPWDSTSKSIQGRLELLIDDDVENRIVSSVLGSLTYRNREQIRRLLNRIAKWPETRNKRKLDMIRYWAGIGAKYFDFVETFYIKPALFETWRRQMHSADEDLPALAWLCSTQMQQSIDRAPHPKTLLDQWPTFIHGNDPQLYRELENGYACLHLHLSGAYPAPYFWLALMNKRFDERQLLESSDAKNLRGYRTANDLKRIGELIDLARRARSKLLRYVKGRTDEESLLRTLSDCDFLKNSNEETFGELGHKTDAAQIDFPYWEKTACPSLIGERYLLFRVIRAILTIEDNELAELLSRVLWAYVVAKHAFLNTVQQAEGTAGFDYFEHTFRLVKWRLPGQEKRCAEEIGNFLQESGCLVKLELMIAPADKASDYDRDIELARVIQKRIEDRQSRKVRERCGLPRVGIIVHFIKDHGESLHERLTKDKNAYHAYHSKVRDRVSEQYNQLIKHFNQSPESDVTICGIDAANRELYCPPEVFSEVFQRAVPELRRRVGKRLRTIGRTFHVGEDFAHLGTGLRRIYEALVFLDLRPGDRLGHACALGIDPARWAMYNPTVEMHLIDILDDAVVEAILLRSFYANAGNGIDERRMSELMRTIDECCVEIYGETIPLVQLEKAWRMRARASRNGAAKFQDDASVPRWVRKQHKQFKSKDYESAGSHSLAIQIRDFVKADEKVPSDTAERISAEYHHDIRTIRRFLKIKTVDATNAVSHLSVLQSAIAKEANNRGIVVESNPSSNWLIGGLESHSEIPAVRWMSTEKETSNHVAFTINPDDPTVFANSIENEYFMVFSAAVHSVGSMSRVECLRKIAEIRERSLHGSFLD